MTQKILKWDDPELLPEIGQSIALGMGFMIPSSPILNALHCITVSAIKHNQGFSASLRQIYQPEAQQVSFWNFSKGYGPFFLKESSKQCYRAPGNMVLRPMIEERFKRPQQANLVWTSAMTVLDMATHCFDTARVRLQAKQNLDPKTLYAGSLLNASKHFGQYYLIASYNYQAQCILKQQGIAPYGLQSTLIQTPGLALLMTLCLYPMERLKIAKQTGEAKGLNFFSLGKKILEQQGLKGLYRGGTARFFGCLVQGGLATGLYNLVKEASESPRVVR